MSDIYYSNIELDPDAEYFLYIGELKNFGLNLYLKEALTRNLNRRFDFISVVPDVFEQYNYPNLMVVNPAIERHSCRYGKNFTCRASAIEFMTSVSGCRELVDLIETLHERQDHVYIYMYESLPEMTLDRIPGVSILGPQSRIASRLNSKIYQYSLLESQVPIVDHGVCRQFSELIDTTDRLWQQWKDGIFVSLEYSAAGVNSTIAHCRKDIEKKFGSGDGPFLISRFIPHRFDPTVLAVVANENDVFIAGVADQRIENGTRFTGSTYPTVLPASVVSQLKELTRSIGRILASEGYRGIFGCDFLVDDDERIFFLEVNARKQGTTLEFTCTLEQSLPETAPTLPELEYYAVARHKFPEHTVEPGANPENIHWGTYNYKIDRFIQTNGYFPQQAHERQAFWKVAHKKLKKDFLILEHVGSDFIVAEGSFLGRIVALGQDHASVRQGIEQGKKTIELTIDNNFQFEDI